MESSDYNQRLIYNQKDFSQETLLYKYRVYDYLCHPDLSRIMSTGIFFNRLMKEMQTSFCSSFFFYLCRCLFSIYRFIFLNMNIVGNVVYLFEKLIQKIIQWSICRKIDPKMMHIIRSRRIPNCHQHRSLIHVHILH